VVSNLVSSEHEGNLNTAEPYPSSGEIHSQQSSISQTMSESTWGTEETVQTEVSSRDDGQEVRSGHKSIWSNRFFTLVLFSHAYFVLMSLFFGDW
jgi:hypothetical protein